MTENSRQHTRSFTDFGLDASLLQAIKETGYTEPTPIQAEALPVALAGRDIMGAAQTGTGKTAAFTLPVLQRLLPLANESTSPARHPVRALILTPTRELADQVASNASNYAKHTNLRVAVVYGGVDINPQRETLRRGCEVLIATPGRLLDHMEQRNVNLSQVAVFILDEADRMLDMGFQPDLERIVSALPQQRQGLLFSATFSKDIRQLARRLLTDPVEIEVAQRNAAADTVTQIAYHLKRPEDKRAAVAYLIRERKLEQVLVFTNTRIGTGRLARELSRQGLQAESIHGDKSQAERMKALEAFKQGELRALVATDVAGRGLDVEGISCVINYDLPFNAEDYVHRIGRTGRAGATGEAMSLYVTEEAHLLEAVEALIQQTIPRSRLPIESGRRSRGRHTEEVVDDFFFRPYVPAEPASSQPSTAKEKTREQTPPKKVGVLLGD